MTRIYRAFDGTEAAIASDYDFTTSGHVIVIWDNGAVISDGWVEDKRLFVPRDPQAGADIYLDADDPDAGWYDIETGRPALVIDGQLAVFA